MAKRRVEGVRFDLASKIVAVPDFPRPGIVFRDIMPLIADPEAFSAAVEALSEACPPGPGIVAGIESRGFIFGAAVASRLNYGFVPIRKKGRLPRVAASVSYELEYGRDTLEIPLEAFGKVKDVVLLDDLLATGGTMAAAAELVESAGARVSRVLFLVELTALGGREKLAGREVRSLVTF